MIGLVALVLAITLVVTPLLHRDLRRADRRGKWRRYWQEVAAELAASIAARSLFADDEDEQWRRDLVAFHTEERVSMTILRPESFVIVTGTTA